MSVVQHFSFSSTNQVESALKGLMTASVTQSEPGPLEFDLSVRQVGTCQIARATTNRALLVTGHRSTAAWVATPITATCDGARYRGVQVAAGTLLLADPGGEIFQQVQAGHRQASISIPIALAEHIVKTEHQCDPDALLRTWALQPDAHTAQQVEALFDRFLDPHNGLLQRYLDHPDELAADVLALVLAGVTPNPMADKLAHRRQILVRAEALMHARLSDPPSIEELCRASFSSRRRLFYTFEEFMGRSPSAHMKLLRLHSARQRLLSDSNEQSIHQVAQSLGFNHPGQFAIDYRKAFGESPSHTRRTATV